MAKIILQIQRKGSAVWQVFAFEKSQVSLGRAYNNDLIVQDPHVNAHHISIALLENGDFELRDMGSLNGVWVGPNQRIDSHLSVTSGTVVTVGLTRVMVLNENHPVAETLSIKAEVAERKPVANARNLELLYAVVGCFILLLVEILNSYERTNTSYLQMTFQVVSMFMPFAVWALVWSIVGSLVKHRFNYGAHFKLICFYSIVMTLFSNFGQWLGFIFVNAILETIMISLLFSSSFVWLLYQHFAFATLMRKRTRMMASIIIPLLLVGLWSIKQYGDKDEFQPAPPYYYRIMPPIVKPYRVIEAEDFITRSADIFTTPSSK